jgi:hypothetical protein
MNLGKENFKNFHPVLRKNFQLDFKKKKNDANLIISTSDAFELVSYNFFTAVINYITQ